MKQIKINNFQKKAIRNHLYKFQCTLDPQEKLLLKASAPFTMLPPERLIDTFRSAKQIISRNPNCALVEFGVFKGGSLAAMSYAARLNKRFSGKIFGFDTFAGHTIVPQKDEYDIHGTDQYKVFKERQKLGKVWAFCSKTTVEKNLLQISISLKTKFKKTILVEGDAFKTAKLLAIKKIKIGLLRLDMDWEKPTARVLHLIARFMPKHSIVIIDDYGHHTGVKKCTDFFIKNLKRKIDYTMTDYSCLRMVFLD